MVNSGWMNEKHIYIDNYIIIKRLSYSYVWNSIRLHYTEPHFSNKKKKNYVYLTVTRVERLKAFNSIGFH
jgi:hypothetical protein